MSDPLGELPITLALAQDAATAAQAFLAGLDRDPAAPPTRDAAGEAFSPGPLPEHGVGGAETLLELVESGLPAATRSAGPRFFHFVTGGATPAALAADWLTSALDQNSFSWVSSPLGSRAELVAVSWLKELFALPAQWGGVLTTGATMANFTALAAARHWWGREHGRDVAAEGLGGLPALPVLSSGYIHASAVKALAMLGLGRERVQRITRDAVGRLDLVPWRPSSRAWTVSPAADGHGG